jgi:CubicO group peptidase (beta-lactamase class C family)
VVERLSGLSYDEYLRRNVWGPAGMTPPSEKAALCYARFTENDPLGVEPRRPETVRGGGGGKARVFGCGGGAYTDDLYRFARAAHRQARASGDRRQHHQGRGIEGRIDEVRARLPRSADERQARGGAFGVEPDTGHDADLQMVWEDQ